MRPMTNCPQKSGGEGNTNLDEIVNSFEVHQIIVFDIHTQAEEQTCISSINNFIISELDKVGVFCITDFSKIFFKKHFKYLFKQHCQKILEN